MPRSIEEQIEQLDLEITLLEEKLDSELEQERIIAESQDKFKKRPQGRPRILFKPSRITAYKVQLLKVKRDKLENVRSRLNKQQKPESFDLPFTILGVQLTLDQKYQISKNLRASIIERTLAHDYDKANEYLRQKRTIDKEISREEKQIGGNNKK